MRFRSFLAENSTWFRNKVREINKMLNVLGVLGVLGLIIIFTVFIFEPVIFKGTSGSGYTPFEINQQLLFSLLQGTGLELIGAAFVGGLYAFYGKLSSSQSHVLASNRSGCSISIILSLIFMGLLVSSFLIPITIDSKNNIFPLVLGLSNTLNSLGIEILGALLAFSLIDNLADNLIQRNDTDEST